LYEFNVEENKCESCKNKCTGDNEYLDWEEDEDECICRECGDNSYIGLVDGQQQCIPCKAFERLTSDKQSCELIPCKSDQYRDEDQFCKKCPSFFTLNGDRTGCVDPCPND
jgi:hypothetical protein